MEPETTDYRLERWIALILFLLFFLPFIAQGQELVQASGIRAAEIEDVAAARTDAAPLPARTHASYALGQRLYDLRCHCDTHPDPEGFVECTLWLESEGSQQILLRFASMEEGKTLDVSDRVTFAGDLDRDGRLDLIADVSGQWDEWRVALFLSTAAREGDLVAHVAEFRAGR